MVVFSPFVLLLCTLWELCAFLNKYSAFTDQKYIYIYIYIYIYLGALLGISNKIAFTYQKKKIKHKEGETIDHLVLFCKKASILWNLVFSLFGVQWALHPLVKRNLVGWHGALVGKRREKTWEGCPFML